MSMSEENWESKSTISIEGIVDTGIIVIAHFDNPIKKDFLIFLSQPFSINKPTK